MVKILVRLYLNEIARQVWDKILKKPDSTLTEQAYDILYRKPLLFRDRRRRKDTPKKEGPQDVSVHKLLPRSPIKGERALGTASVKSDL